MPLTTTARLVDEARSRGSAIGAFNVITLEHVEAVVRGAERAAVAVIIQVSENALAVAVGSSHAMTTQTARLDHDLIRLLAEAVSVPLVLHGSSGVPSAELASAVAAGMRKLNIGTALNVAYTRAVRQVLGSDGEVTDPRKYLDGARDAAAEVVATMLTVISG